MDDQKVARLAVTLVARLETVMVWLTVVGSVAHLALQTAVEWAMKLVAL